MAVRSSVPAAGQNPFSHLSRATQAGKKADEDDLDDEALDDEGDDDEDDEDDDEKDKNGKKNKKSKSKKKAEDDQDEDDEEKPDARAIRRRERIRVATILNSAAGKRFPDAAKHLAFRTATPRWRAVRLLRGMGQNTPQSRDGGSLRDRMAIEPLPDVGAGDAQSQGTPGSSTLAAAIIAAGKKRRGEV